MSADAQQTDRLSRVQSNDAPTSPDPSSSSKPLRMRTNTAEIDSTIIHPGSVKINVTGAFIVDQDSGSPTHSNGYTNGGSHDTKDIRLPNHTAVVSHIAVDVGSLLIPLRMSILIPMADWRVPGQARLLLQRTQVSRTGWPSEFHELRDRQNRRLRRVYEAVEN
jgi:hypothetical protein